MAKKNPGKKKPSKFDLQLREREKNRKAALERIKNVKTVRFSYAETLAFVDKIVIGDEKNEIILEPNDVAAAEELVTELEDFIKHNKQSEEEEFLEEEEEV